MVEVVFLPIVGSLVIVAVAIAVLWRAHRAKRVRLLAALLRRYLDNHCANADAEGMSTLCECELCLDTRKALGQ